MQVLDFGFATQEDHRVQELGGTPRYMAPELLENAPSSIETDLYSVGVLLYQLCTDEHPFGQFDVTFFDRQLSTRPDLADVPPALHQIVQRLLAPAPEDRYSSASALLEALSKAVVAFVRLPTESDAIRKSYLQAARFVGREKELSQLQAALAKATSGEGSAWIIGGESGVGKSRLLHELKTHALVAGFTVLFSQAALEGDGQPFSFWREPLSNLLIAQADVDELTVSVLKPLIPNIESILQRPVADLPKVDEEAARLRLFSTITELCINHSLPLLIVLEDLHWANESLAPLPYLQRQVSTHPIMIVGSYRSDEFSLGKETAGFQEMLLNRLTAEQMGELSAAMLGKIGRRPEIQEIILRESEGNTFFAVEIVQMLGEMAGQLRNIGRQTFSKTLLPNGILDIVVNRLRRIPEESHDLIYLCAMIGRAVDLRLIKHLNPDIGFDIVTWWLPLCADAALLEIQQGRWQFTHSKVRDGLLTMISLDTKQVNHRLIAQGIITLYGNVPEQAGRLALHWEGAGENVLAAEAALSAAQYTAGQYANDEALYFLDKGYALTPKEALQTRLEIIKKQHNVYTLIGNLEKQKEIFDKLDALLTQLGSPAEEEVDLLIKQGTYYYLMGDIEESLKRYDYAQHLAEEIDHHPYKAALFAARARVFVKYGKYDEAEADVQASLAFYESEKASAEIVDNLETLIMLYFFQGRTSEAVKYIEQMIDIADQINDRFSQAQALDKLGLSYYSDGKIDQAIEIFHQANRLNSEIGSPKLKCLISNRLGVLIQEKGDLEEAQIYWEAIDGVTELIGQVDFRILNVFNKCENSYMLGDLEDALTHAEAGIAMSREIDFIYALSHGLLFLAQIKLHTQQFQAAQTAAEEALQLKEKLKQPTGQVWGLLNLGYIALARNDLTRAHTHFDRGLSVSVDPKDGLAQGSITRIHVGLADLFVRSQNAERASAHLHTAFERLKGSN
ncbi:MAG: AAA family ATPase, partial [Chloroflexota bacterium]